IADAALVVLVVSLQLVGILYNLLVQRMLYMLLNSNHDCLIHFIAYDLADTRFSQISFHDNSPSALLRIRFLRDNSLNSGDVPANLFDSACVIELIGCVLES